MSQRPNAIKQSTSRKVRPQTQLQSLVQSLLSPPARKRRVPRRRPQATPQSTGMDAPISRARPAPNRSRSNPTTKIGTDYISQTSIPTNLADGTILFDLRIEPDLLPSLSSFLKSYRQWRPNKLRFDLSSHMPTTSTGGYIMAFLPDASTVLDTTTPNSIKQQVTASPNSIKTNIWNSTHMLINRSRRTRSFGLTTRWLYTTVLDDPREFSPGRLVVVTDGVINTPGSLSLSIEFSCNARMEALVVSSSDSPSPLSNALVPSQHFQFHAPSTEAPFTMTQYANNQAPLTWSSIFSNYVEPTQDTFFEMTPITIGGDVGPDIVYALHREFMYDVSDDRFYLSYGFSRLPNPYSEPTGFLVPSYPVYLLSAPTPESTTTITNDRPHEPKIRIIDTFMHNHLINKNKLKTQKSSFLSS